MIFGSSLTQILLRVPALILAFTIHEISHGLMAYLLGDSTAKRDGRLSLNPIKHIDPLGLVFILIVGFGWAKPVMVNPYNLNNPKVDMALIAAAGPISNFILAFIGMMILYPLAMFTDVSAYVIYAMTQFTWINIVLGIFNMLPIPPLDGSKVIAGALPDSIYNNLPPVGRYGMIVLLVLMITGITGRILSPLVRGAFEMLHSVATSIYGI